MWEVVALGIAFGWALGMIELGRRRALRRRRTMDPVKLIKFMAAAHELWEKGWFDYVDENTSKTSTA